MSLPLHPPYAPMEARVVDEIPTDPGWQYEPKWDGFRCLAFRDGDRIELQSKNGQPLARYFPEVVAHLRSVSRTPVLTGLPFGHVRTKVTLPVGRKVELAVQGRDVFVGW